MLQNFEQFRPIGQRGQRTSRGAREWRRRRTPSIGDGREVRRWKYIETLSDMKRKQKTMKRKIILCTYVWRRKFNHFFLKNKRVFRSLFQSSLLSIVIIFACIIQENKPESYIEKIDMFTQIAHWFSNSTYNDDSVLYVDTSKDQQEAKYILDKDTIGTVAVTNRKLLREFLIKAQNSNSGFVFIDLGFDRTDFTEWDNSLKEQISSMSNVLVARSSNNDSQSLRDSFYDKFSATVAYRKTFMSPLFTRQIYIEDGDSSASLKIYNYLHHEMPIKLYRIPIPFTNIYASSGGIFRNCPIIKINGIDPLLLRDNVSLLGKIVAKDSSFCLSQYKIIFVGDFEKDKHETYAGSQYGPLLVFHAYSALETGTYIIPYWLIIIMFVIYSVMSLRVIDKIVFLFIYLKLRNIIIGSKCYKFIAKLLSNSKLGIKSVSFISNLYNCLYKTRCGVVLMRFGGTLAFAIGSLIVDFVWYSVILSCFSLLLYLWLNQIYSVFIPAFGLTLVSFYKEFRRQLKTRK